MKLCCIQITGIRDIEINGKKIISLEGDFEEDAQTIDMSDSDMTRHEEMKRKSEGDVAFPPTEISEPTPPIESDIPQLPGSGGSNWQNRQNTQSTPQPAPSGIHPLELAQEIEDEL